MCNPPSLRRQPVQVASSNRQLSHFVRDVRLHGSSGPLRVRETVALPCPSWVCHTLALSERVRKEAVALPGLQTERLTLRQISEADAEGLHAAYGDPEAMRYWNFPATRDVAETASCILQSLAVDERWHAVWAILLKDGGFAGMINYHHREPWNRRLELGWILASAYWRQGLMGEAAQAVLHHCFTAMNTHRIEALIEPENVASLALATKLGFTPESGLLRDRLCVDGRFRSVLMYGLLEPDWSRLVSRHAMAFTQRPKG
jgi:[ribosomal protein S5]-alanine N-acetyltransferase